MKQKKDSILVLLLLILAVFVFDFRCPVEEWIGIPCPGCGMSSALYWLLQGDLKSAYFFHPGIFAMVIYGLIVLFCAFNTKESIFDHVIVKKATMIVVVLLLLIYVGRMVIIFPEYPMQVNYDAFVQTIIHR